MAFWKAADNFAHLGLPLGYAKMCQLARRFNCLLIRMEQWRAGGNERDRLRERESNERSELSNQLFTDTDSHRNTRPQRQVVGRLGARGQPSSSKKPEAYLFAVGGVLEKQIPR